jgi:anhydro-N-acetylmuramic acid kinase
MPKHQDPGTSYVGLMSGTSMDGIDAVLVEFGDHRCQIRSTLSAQYPEELRSALLKASRTPTECTVDLIGRLDHWVGECFRDASLALLKENGVAAGEVVAIGSHGQTLRHQPHAARPFTLQIGDPNIIATGTGITTVADFRRADVTLGGEGAPLAPAFHQWLFAGTDANRAVLNIGGIANVTMLLASSPIVTGLDTGPGNTLLDSMARRHLDKPYDEGGAWAAAGTVSKELLRAMLSDRYFELPPPKSTGFEYFNAAWLKSKISSLGKAAPEAGDIQATLAELSAQTIATAILKNAPEINEVLVCGGGVHNTDLLRRLTTCLAGSSVESTEAHGLHPDWVEAAAFAWLAKRRLEGKPGNLPEVTGASRPELLGAIYRSCLNTPHGRETARKEY